MDKQSKLLGWCECCATPILKIPFTCPGCASYYDDNYDWTGKQELIALNARIAELEAENSELTTAVVAETLKARELEAKRRYALEKIANYGKDGICPFGCDCPNIAMEAQR